MRRSQEFVQAARNFSFDHKNANSQSPNREAVSMSHCGTISAIGLTIAHLALVFSWPGFSTEIGTMAGYAFSDRFYFLFGKLFHARLRPSF